MTKKTLINRIEKMENLKDFSDEIKKLNDRITHLEQIIENNIGIYIPKAK